MANIESLSCAIIEALRNFDRSKLLDILDDKSNSEATTSSRIELIGLLDDTISAEKPSFAIMETRPKSLDCDVVRFQNNKEKWVAFVGLLDGYPYEIFTGVLDDEDGIALPKTVTKGHILKTIEDDGTKHYDFQFVNRRGYKTTIEGLSEKFNKEYWNYAKLISGVLRYRMPLTNVINLVSSLQLDNENINTWKIGVVRALKKYVGGDVSDDNVTDNGQTEE